MKKGIKRPMRKDFNKKGELKQYLISLGVNTEIDEDRFYQNDNGKMVCDVLVCLPDEIEKMTEEHQKFQSQIPSLEKSLEEKEQSIEKLQNQLSAIDEDHQKKMGELQDQYSEEIDQLKADLQEKSLEIERTKTKYEKEIGDLKEDYEKQIGEFREEIQKQINSLKVFDEEKHMLIKDHNSEVSALKENQFNPEFHMSIIDHQKEVNAIKDSIVRQTIQYNDKISELNAINLWKYLKGELSSISKDLKEGIDNFEMIAQYIESKNGAIIPDVKKSEDDEE